MGSLNAHLLTYLRSRGCPIF
nr:hypothetical protein [Chlamydia trachomatis]